MDACKRLASIQPHRLSLDGSCLSTDDDTLPLSSKHLSLEKVHQDDKRDHSSRPLRPTSPCHSVGSSLTHHDLSSEFGSGSLGATPCCDDSRVHPPLPNEHVVLQSKPLFSSPNTPFSVVSDFLVLAWCLLCHSLLTAWPYVGLAIAIGSFFSQACLYITIIAFTTLLLPMYKQPMVVKVLDALIFQFWRRQSSYNVTYSDAMDSKQQYLIAEFPHGVYPLAGQLHACSWPNFHSMPVSMLAADVLFYLPLWRHYMGIGGAVPASRKVLDKLLRDGECASVHVGGIAEMFECYPDKEAVVLKRRKGFVRAALAHGVPIIPMYHFGNSQILSIGPRWFKPVSRKLKTSLGVIFGFCGLPIPRWKPLWTVAGPPIDVGPPMAMDDPTFEQRVDEVHGNFTLALANLYETHRAHFFDGEKYWTDRPLLIV